MRTIFITCFTGLIGRNILSTGAFRMLAERPDIRLVVLAPVSRAKFLRQEYAAPNIIVETVATPALGGRDKLIWVLATNLYIKTAQGWRLASHHASPGTPHERPVSDGEAPTTLH